MNNLTQHSQEAAQALADPNIIEQTTAPGRERRDTEMRSNAECPNNNSYRQDQRGNHRQSLKIRIQEITLPSRLGVEIRLTRSRKSLPKC